MQLVLGLVGMHFEKGVKKVKTIQSESLCIHLRKNVTVAFEKLDFCSLAFQ